MNLAHILRAIFATLKPHPQVCQLPLPFDVLGCERPQKRRAGIQAVLVVTGGMLLFFTVMGAVVLGRLASMPPDTAATAFHAYPFLQSIWPPLIAVGPIAFVISSALGMFCLGKGLDAIGH